MNNIEEVQDSIRQLSSVGREIIADWLRDFMLEEECRVGEPATAYGARAKRDFMSIEDYLKFEEGTPSKHEYVAGEIFAMSGGSLEHELIAGNVFEEFHGGRTLQFVHQQFQAASGGQ